jgi:phosphatidylserine/phosphatidylglycerophosphate/cardiolipin synthase-like enzyme
LLAKQPKSRASKRKAIHHQGLLVGTDDLTFSQKSRFSYRAAFDFALATFQESIVMTSPYLTSTWAVNRLVKAADRLRKEGKDPSKIVIVVPVKPEEKRSNEVTAHHNVLRLQKAGITVQRFYPKAARERAKANPYTDEAMLHAKAWIIDGKVGYISSTNLNDRSLHRDWETGMFSADPTFVKQLKERMIGPTLRLSQNVPPMSTGLTYWGKFKNLLYGDLLKAF